MFIKYIIIFIIFSVLGWVYEYLVWNKSKPDGITKTFFHIDLPILPIYGLGAIVLLYIHNNFKTSSLLYKIIVASIAINIIECVGGLCSYKFYGYQTWRYNSDLCYGYISIPTAIFWSFLCFIFFLCADFLEGK